MNPRFIRTTAPPAALLLAVAALVVAPGASKNDNGAASPDQFKPKGPNMVENGGFSEGADHPTHWDPMPPHVFYEDIGGEHGKVIHFKVPREVARTTGLKYWSDYIPVEPNHTYTFNFDCKAKGGVNLKVFLKGFMEHQGRRREIYRAPVHIYAGKGEWVRYGRREPFSTAHPSGRKVQWVRFMLYAYGGGEGEAWWDNFHMEEIVSTPEDDL